MLSSKPLESEVAKGPLEGVVPEQQDATGGYGLGPPHDEFSYIKKMTKGCEKEKGTYLPFVEIRRGLMSQLLNHANQSSHGAAL